MKKIIARIFRLRAPLTRRATLELMAEYFIAINDSARSEYKGEPVTEDQDDRVRIAHHKIFKALSGQDFARQ